MGAPIVMFVNLRFGGLLQLLFHPDAASKEAIAENSESLQVLANSLARFLDP